MFLRKIGSLYRSPWRYITEDGILKLITVFTKSCHTGSCPETGKYCPPSHPSYLRLILILFPIQV
jgi:hypothetical protein